MKTLIPTTLFIFMLSSIVSGQIIADFEDLSVPADSFLNQASNDFYFESQGLRLYNNFVPEWQSWDGWAISSTTDTVTPGFSNQYSSITGGGAGSESTYAVSYVVGSSRIAIGESETIDNIDGIYVTNNTYAYYSMLEGDAFAKKFGGLTGDDPDFFKLTIYGFRDGEYLDSLDFYLADYRFEDNTQDYIISDWEYIEVSALGQPDSLEFFLSSSDNGTFGMNTPAYFCMDDVEMSTLSNTQDLGHSVEVAVYPNPTTDQVTISAQQVINRITLVDIVGQVVKVIEGDKSFYTMYLDELKAGSYTLVIESNNSTVSQSLVKY